MVKSLLLSKLQDFKIYFTIDFHRDCKISNGGHCNSIHLQWCAYQNGQTRFMKQMAYFWPYLVGNKNAT